MRFVLRRLKNLTLWNRPIPLPEKHKWTRVDETQLAAWTVKARPYNTKIIGSVFAIYAVIFAMVTSLLFNDDTSITEYIAVSLIYGLCLWAVGSGMLAKTNYGYRLTLDGVEECEWTDLSKTTLLMAKGVAILAAIASVFMMALGPMAFLVSLGGAGGMGLMYAYMVNSEGFREWNSSYYVYDHAWNKFTSVSVDRSRRLICPKYPWVDARGRQRTGGECHLWCRKKDFEATLELVRRQVPDVPFIEEKVEMH